MCGIAGWFGRGPSFAGAPPSEDQRAALAHRGPDDFGAWQDEGVSLLHWRLSVVDLSPAGHQPMASQDGRYVLCYNGEIYGFSALREEIERAWSARDGASGPDPARRWRGHSDTEVIVEGLALWGLPFLARLNGMFALALFDRASRTLHLARDRAGIKPLYVWEGDRGLLFASEAKFFFRTRAFTPALSADGLAAYMAYGLCYEGHHALRGVRKLEPGEVLSCERGAGAAAPPVLRTSRLCPRPARRPVERTDEDAASALRAVLTRAVSRQLIADVPVGVLLSGGVDSSILTALASRELGAAQTTAFTLGYPGMGPDYDELDYARRVAAHLGVRHEVYLADQDDLVGAVERLVWHYDEPFADAAALNVWVLSKRMRSQVTVALAGEGADELFGGYRRYQFEQTVQRLGVATAGVSAVVRAAKLDSFGGVPRRVQVVLRALAHQDSASRYSSYFRSEIPLAALLKPEWRRTISVHPRIQDGYRERLPRETVGQLCLVDQQFWLPSAYLEKSDKGAMAHALELRVPYLDNEVVELANSLPDRQRIRGRRRKWLLWKAFHDLLPAEVFQRFKRGFGVPVAHWLRSELRDYYLSTVLSPEARLREYLELGIVERCFRDHASRRYDYSQLLWKCLVLETWLRHFERGFQPPAPLARPAPRGAEDGPPAFSLERAGTSR